MSNTPRLAAANAARRERRSLKTFTCNLTGVRRGNARVHRYSYHAGETERRQWRAHNIFSARERRARFKAIQEWNHAEKKKGQCWGPLGPNGERVLDFLMGRRDFGTGQLDPAISEMSRVLKLCIQTIVTTTQRLIDAGLIQKLRRTRQIEDAEPDGPQIEQITNAYWLTLPKAILQRVQQLLAQGGKPADQAQHEADQAASLTAMLAQLSAEDLARFHAGDHGPIAGALSRLGRAFDQARARL